MAKKSPPSIRHRFWRRIWLITFNLEIWAMDRYRRVAPDEAAETERGLAA